LALARVAARLNGLVEVCCDGIAGYDEAARLARDLELRRLFERLAVERRNQAQDLAAEVERLGGTPRAVGTVRGTLHRGWLRARAPLTSLEVLRECAFGERTALKRYDEALEGDLPADVRTILACQRRRLAAIVELMEELGASLG